MWPYIEADFLRDYGIDLADPAVDMTWRRFSVLYRGLSPHGAVCANWNAVAKKYHATSENAEALAWQAITSFSKPAAVK